MGHMGALCSFCNFSRNLNCCKKSLLKKKKNGPRGLVGEQHHPENRCVCSVAQLSCVRLFVTPWTVACQTPVSMGFSRQEYWSRLPLPSPGDLPDLGMEPESPASPALAGRFFTTSATWEALSIDGFLLAYQYTGWSTNASQGAGEEAGAEVWDAQDPS